MKREELVEVKESAQSVFEGKLLNIEHWQVRLPDGKSALREIAKHVGAVAIVPVDEDNNVTMVWQYRPAIGRAMLEVPAGKLDSAAEERIGAARRELREETGLEATNWQFLTSLVPSPGYLTEQIALYMARGLTQGETSPDEDEFLNVEKRPLNQLVEQVMSGEIMDAKTQVAILMAARKLGI